MTREAPGVVTRVQSVWHRIHDSLWFLPAVLVAGALLLAAFTLDVDRRFVFDEPDHFLLRGGAAGARGVLTAIAGGIITVTGVVFSVTIVALQLASTQFTPRVLRSFMSDRGNQLVLGVFIATFTYSLVVLRTVVGGDDPAGFGFVPNFSVTVAVGLALVSIGFLIYYIDHAAYSVQASAIIKRVHDDTIEVVERLFLSDREATGTDREIERAADFAKEHRAVPCASPGYVQGIDERRLLRLAVHHDLRVRVEPEIGEYVIEGAPIAFISGPHGDHQEIETALHDCIITGHERILRQDVQRGIIELSDIALKGLSPALNDPTTAMIAIDRAADILAAVGRRAWPDPILRDEAGTARVYVQRPAFNELVDVAYDQVRHFAAEQPTVIAYLISRLGRIGSLIPPDRRGAVRHQIQAAASAARRGIEESGDLERVERITRESLAMLVGTDPDAVGNDPPERLADL